MPPKLLLPITFALAFNTFLPCQAEDMPSPDLSAVIAELKAITDNQKAARQSTLSVAISQFEASAANPSNAARAYADAKRVVDFDGQTNAGLKFAEWRKKNDDLLRSKGLQMAATLHLDYLALSLRQCGEPDTAARVQESLDYVAQLGESRTSNAADLKTSNEVKDLLNKPIQEGVIAKAAQISEVLGKLKGWEMVAGNIDGILEKNVRRVLRKEKDTRVIDTWDLQLDLEGKVAKTSDSEIAITNFENTRRPQLLWRKATEFVTIGQPVRGLSLMVELIRTNPTHPEMETWLEQATSLARAQQGTP